MSRPVAVVGLLLALGSAGYWIWRAVAVPATTPVVAQAVIWSIMTVLWVADLIRGPMDEASGSPEREPGRDEGGAADSSH